MLIKHLRLPKNVFENFVVCDISNVKPKSILLMKQEWKRHNPDKLKLREYITLEIKVAVPIMFPLYYLNLTS